MRQSIKLNSSWYIKQLEPTERLNSDQLLDQQNELCNRNNGWVEATMPSEVHEILLNAGIIEDPYIDGKAKDCIWVSESDWIYKYSFKCPNSGRKINICFKGLDTFADIYLNGECLAIHNNMFLPLEIEVTNTLKEYNTLILHFHSPQKYLQKIKMPKVWVGKMNPQKMLRKAYHDFDDYLGGKPYLTTIGIYDDIVLDILDGGEILETDINTCISEKYSKANINIYIKGLLYNEPGKVNVVVKDPEGKVVFDRDEDIKDLSCNSWEKNLQVTVNKPELWWPRGYGSQCLYSVIISLIVGTAIEDAVTKNIGIRKVDIDSSFDCHINNRQVKLWGANFTPLEGITHCWKSQSANRILDMVENANMNILRIWGEGSPYSDELYNEADRRGILLWQEFYTGYGMYPDNKEYRESCRKEAEYLVKRLKHHPSILLWCGGNENFMGRDFSFPDEEYIGSEIFVEDYKMVCGRLDPDRYYHMSSPYGGAYANDPAVGDTHSYTNTWYVPGADYPVFVSENLRVAPPCVKSLKRFIKDDKLWPKDYTGLIKHDDLFPWPDLWAERSSAEGWKKIPPIEKFYDTNTLEETVYKFGAAYGLYLRETVERYRRGRSSEDVLGERICKGHMVWKLNSTWPYIYSSVIDYYLEAYIPYYALKRAYEPILLSFDIKNHIYLWLVNDSSSDVEGDVKVCLFNSRTNSTVKETYRHINIKAGKSEVITNLDEFGQFARENILFAYLTDNTGRIVTRSNDYVDIEKHLKFPAAKLELRNENDVLIISTDKFARCIELEGDDEGDKFGWMFEDNYFDLLPGEVKKIKIAGKHKKGKISAKAHYSNYVSEIHFDDGMKFSL